MTMLRDFWDELGENGKGFVFIFGCVALGAIVYYVNVRTWEVNAV